MKRCWLTIVLLALSGGTAAGREPGDIYGSEPFAGPVSVQVFTPDARSKPRSERGTGSARFVPVGPSGEGRARLEVRASIRRSNDSGFVLEGSQNGARWNGRSKSLSITIGPDGRISGGGVENQHRITFSGNATADQMDLKVETLSLAKPASGTGTGGTRIVFDYDLEREASRSATQASSANRDKIAGDKKTCKKRVWKARNVTTPGGGMTLIQVPHCVD